MRHMSWSRWLCQDDYGKEPQNSRPSFPRSPKAIGRGLGSDSVIAGRVGELKPNTGKVFRFGNRPGLLIRSSNGEYRAMSATCTHLSCTVQYRDDLHQVWCACHNGTYDLNGRNISGPPPRPLEGFEVQVRGEEIFVRRRRDV